ncbi:hypothetical protein R1flu_027118 [Riccia fluitans]|uniref:Uncharacterized protein n=1 Tax=Riccia fluitans TaxID=41844 RepID=A0ABD1XIE6_9MARC
MKGWECLRYPLYPNAKARSYPQRRTLRESSCFLRCTLRPPLAADSLRGDCQLPSLSELNFPSFGFELNGLGKTIVGDIVTIATVVAMAQSLLLPMHRVAVMASMAPMPSSAFQQRLVTSSSSLNFSCATPAVRVSKFQLNAVPGSVLGVEPDLQEDEYDIYMTAGEDREDEFEFGKADGHHTYHEGDHDIGFIEGFQLQIEESGGPATNPGQNLISWLYLPGLFSAMAFGVKVEYILAGCVLFIFAFIGIEMAKPDQPWHLEPEISRQDRNMNTKSN